jgi:biopolymer transport protein ExbB/TolQ
MSAEKQPDTIRPETDRQNSRLMRVGIYAGVLLAVFLLGLIPMWLTARESASQLAEARRELKLLQIQNTLASAAVDARRAEYEPARQAASDFFVSLRAEMDRGNDSALTQAQRDRVTQLFAQRDEIITLLARSDPVSADRLSDLYLAYRRAMKGA